MAGLAAAVQGDVVVRTVTRTGQPAAPGMVFDRFDAPAINREGRVLFWSRLAMGGAAADECETAIPLSLGRTFMTTVGATTSTNITPCSLRRDVWARYTAPTNQTLTVSFRGTNFASSYGMARGSCGQLIQGTCSQTSIGLVQGETVFFRIGSNNPEADPGPRGSGSGVLSIWPSPTGMPRTMPMQTGLFAGDHRSFEVLARTGDVLRSKPTPLFHTGFEFPAWSDAGVFATAGGYQTEQVATGPAYALFTGTAEGGTTLLEAEEMPTPPAVVMQQLVPPRLDSEGRPAFATLTGDRLVYAGVTRVAGDPAIGMPEGAVFERFSQPMVASDATAFRASVTGGGTTEADNVALWVDDGAGAMAVIARLGGAVPGVAGATFIRLPTDFAIGGDGAIGYHARIAGEGVDATNNAGIWTTRGGVDSLVARTGDVAPVPGAGAAVFTSLSAHVVMNAGNDIAFAGSIAGEEVNTLSNTGIWLSPAKGDTRLVVREGDQVPGLPADVRFATFSNPVMNARGDLAFTATVRGPDINYPTSSVLVFVESGGPPRIMARTGSEIDGVVLHEIRLGASAQGTGRASMNDAGIMVFEGVFADGSSGIFTAEATCPADFNADRTVDSADFFAFLTAFMHHEPAADFNDDGFTNSQDFFDYLAAYFTACGR